jgi:hypothetical protein
VRIANRLLAFVAALALAAAGVITVVEVIGERGFKSGPVIVDWRRWLHWGQHNTWQALSVELTCGAIALVGLLLVLTQLRPRRPSRIAIQAADHTSVALTRSGLATTVRSAVLDVEGIDRAKVTVRRRGISIRASSAAATAAEAKGYAAPVREAVTEQLEPLELQRPQRVSVRVQARRKETED